MSLPDNSMPSSVPAVDQTSTVARGGMPSGASPGTPRCC